MRTSTSILVPVLSLTLLGACGGGGSGGGGGGGGDAAANLAAIGLAPKDLTDVAGATMLTTLTWALDDAAVPTFGPGCPTYVQGADNDSSGHPDTVEIAFDCADAEEDLALDGSIFLQEYLDPTQFLSDVSPDCNTLLAIDTLGTPTWGLRGSGELTGTEGKGVPFGLSVGVSMAGFPEANKVVVEVTFSFTNYVVEGAGTFLVQGSTCFTLPGDDSSDVPTGFINTYFFDGAPPAALSLECVLLPDGGVSFEAWGSGDDLVAAGTIDVAADADDDEITFD